MGCVPAIQCPKCQYPNFEMNWYPFVVQKQLQEMMILGKPSSKTSDISNTQTKHNELYEELYNDIKFCIPLYVHFPKSNLKTMMVIIVCQIAHSNIYLLVYLSQILKKFTLEFTAYIAKFQINSLALQNNLEFGSSGSYLHCCGSSSNL